MKSLLAVVSLSMLALLGCKSEDKPGGSSDDRQSGLEMTSDSVACKQAMKCCEARVVAEKGKLTPENVNLLCSGVALAETDEECGQFKKGYAMSFESKGKPVPAECK